MLGSLYKLSFDKSSKVYIGKTYETLESRLKDHIRNSIKFPNRKLSKAIIKYGTPKIELIGQFEQGLLENKEIEFISLFDSYHNGYNSTLGGDGRRYISIPDTKIIEVYELSTSLTEASNILKLDVNTIRKVLLANNIDRNKESVQSKSVYVPEADISFNSVIDCAKFIIECELTTAKDPRSVAPNITRVCNGLRKSAYGLSFIYQ